MSSCQEVGAQEVVGWGLGIRLVWAGLEETTNRQSTVLVGLTAPLSTWRSLALGPGPFLVAESESRGQDNLWWLIAQPSVLAGGLRYTQIGAGRVETNETT